MNVRYRSILFLAFLPVALNVYGQAADRAAASDPGAIRKEMLEIERAFVSRDPEPFERIFLEGYVGIRERPVFNAFQQLIAMVRWDASAIGSGKPLSFETISYESDEPQIYIYGDAAIVSVLKKDLWRYRENKCLSRYQSTELWLRSAGNWRIAAGHMTTMQCDPMPWQPPHPALASVRSQLRPTKFLSPAVETELREMIGKITLSGTGSDSGADQFTTAYFSTDESGRVAADRSALITALQTPALKTNEKYRDDDVFLSFGDAALYLFRIRFLTKPGQSTPPPPIVYSVFFVKADGAWKIAASQSSTFKDQ